MPMGEFEIQQVVHILYPEDNHLEEPVKLGRWVE
jgi:hypothetical protein